MNSSLTTSNDFVIKHKGKEVEFVVGYDLNLDHINTNRKTVYYIYPEIKDDSEDDAIKETKDGIEICKLPLKISSDEMTYDEFANYMKNKIKKMIKTINKITCN
ncbi:MAG: hypothetical protein MJ246_03235 [Clostridia bacterium]|nr:hypothetical protein [Clostridia bacterium]